MTLIYKLAVGLVFFSASYSGYSAPLTDNRQDASIEILAAFRGTCISQGSLTQGANTQTNTIIQVVQALKSTSPCQQYQTELTAVQSAAAQIQAVQTNTSYSTYQTDLQNYQLLTMALASTPNGSTLAQSMQTSLNTLRLQLFTDQATYNVSQQTASRNLIVSQATQLTSWSQNLAISSASPGLAQCLAQSPAASLELATNFLGFGASFLPGVFAAGVNVVGQLFNTAFEALRQKQYDGSVFRAQASEMPDALSCALDSMTESYCSADDAFTLIDLARRNRLSNYAADPLWTGIDILNRQLPALLAWLGEIQNEVPPQDNFQASKQESVFQEIFEVQEQNLNTIATINNAVDQANASTDGGAKQAVLANAIASLALQLINPAEQVSTSNGATSVTSVPTPFSVYQPNPVIWACWLVLGPNATCPPLPSADVNPSGVPTTPQLTDYIEKALGVTPDLIAEVEVLLLANWDNLLPKVQVLVNADFARIIATNAGVILSSARVASNGSPLSPFTVLQNTSKFLQAMIDFHVNNPRLPLELKEEKLKIDEAIRQLTAPDSEACPPQIPVVRPGPFVPGAGMSPSPVPAPSPVQPIPLTPDQCQTQRLVNLFNLFGLQNGTQVFLTDINNLVNIDLQNRFVAGAIPLPESKILQASGEDLYVALTSSGSGDLGPAADDADNARADIEENIQTFREFFVPEFQKAVAREAAFAAEENVSRGANRPHSQRLAELCLFWLLTSDIPTSTPATLQNWPDAVTLKACDNSLYFNENDGIPSGGVAVPAFDIGNVERQLAGAHFADRVCLFHKFRIQNKADTLFNIEPGRGR